MHSMKTDCFPLVRWISNFYSHSPERGTVLCTKQVGQQSLQECSTRYGNFKQGDNTEGEISIKKKSKYKKNNKNE